MPRGIRGSLVLVLAAAAFAVLAAPVPAQQLQPGELVVADAEADPNNDASDAAVFRVDPATGVATVLGEHPDFSAPRGVAIDAAGTVYVADPLSDPNGGAAGTGGVFKIVPGQAPTVFATDAEFVNPTGLAIDASGNILVADLNGDPDNLGGITGAIFSVDPVTANVTTSKAGAEIVDPWGVAVRPGGDVLVADREALGNLLTYTPGNPAPAAVFGSHVEFADPSGVATDSAGRILVADPDATAPGRPNNTGALFSVTGTGTVSLLNSSGFDDPFGVDIDATGCAVVADSGVDPNGGGLGNGLGAIFRFVPGQAPAILSASTLFRQPVAVAVNSGGSGCAPPAVTPATPPPSTPGQPAPAPKKCKKGQKLKKGKCVKKKRKKK